MATHAEGGAADGAGGLAAALKAARVARGYSLTEVAAATGISKSSLSLIENGRADVPLRRLIRLAEFYETKLSDLLPEVGETNGMVVMRRTDRQRLYSRPEGLDVHRLVPAGKRSMLPTVCVFSPGGSADFPGHEGEEFVLVLEGRIRCEVEGEPPVVLSRGDSVYYACGRPHSWANAGSGIARVVAVASPPHW